ncbi:uncharacterized protein LOC143599775 [Bidens hawaiensis]|uniref:uncharacterized protein LOC143582757 n=1 Tax=Bidens hawaiensis TaxID=980011 RepID=UPI00404AC6DF
MRFHYIQPSLVVTEEEKESGMCILMRFRYSIQPSSWVVTEQESESGLLKPAPSSESASVEAANASFQHHDSKTSTTKPSLLLYGSSQTKRQMDYFENPTKAVKTITSVPKQPKVKPETKLKKDFVAKLKSDKREDVKLVATARKPSWVVTGSSRTQKRIDDSRNPTKGVKRFGPAASVTKQPKQGPVKTTETKPKKPCVAKVKAPWKF